MLIREEAGFTVELPSSEAVAPGNDPVATALIKEAKSHLQGGLSWLTYLSYGITLVSIIWAVVATIQLGKLKKAIQQECLNQRRCCLEASSWQQITIWGAAPASLRPRGDGSAGASPYPIYEIVCNKSPETTAILSDRSFGAKGGMALVVAVHGS